MTDLLQWVARAVCIFRPIGGNYHQLGTRSPTGDRRKQVDGRIVSPMQIFKHKHECLTLRQLFQKLADLTQHALAAGADDILPQRNPTFERYQSRKLGCPCRSKGYESLYDRFTAGPFAQVTESL